MSILPARVLLNRLQAKARLRHLQVLVKLAELGNLKRSADDLGLSQPAVTQLLADLEALLEVRLFERHSRGVRITAFGEALLPVARRMLGALAEGSETLTAMRQSGEGVVRVAGITGALTGMLAPMLPAFAQAHPRIQVQVGEADFEQGALQLARGEVDLLVMREPAVPPAGYRYLPVQADRFVVACGTHHPLAGKRGLGWPALCRETWLLSPVSSAARAAFDSIVVRLGAHPSVSPIVTRVQSLTWSMLDKQRLLTFVPYSVVRQLVESGRLALVGTREPTPFAPLGLVVPEAGMNTAVATFVDFVQSFDASAS